jgi:hypothetical protein
VRQDEPKPKQTPTKHTQQGNPDADLKRSAVRGSRAAKAPGSATGAAKQAQPEKARPGNAWLEAHGKARPRRRGQTPQRATADPDAELEELSRAGRVHRTMQTSKKSAERDATQNSRSSAVRPKRMAGSAWREAQGKARPRRRGQTPPRAVGDPDAELEEPSRAGRAQRSMQTSKRPAERDATQNSRSSAVRQEEPKPKQKPTNTHTARQPRRRPEEVSRARESSGQGARRGQRRCDAGAARGAASEGAARRRGQ